MFPHWTQNYHVQADSCSFSKEKRCTVSNNLLSAPSTLRVWFNKSNEGGHGKQACHLLLGHQPLSLQAFHLSCQVKMMEGLRSTAPPPKKNRFGLADRTFGGGFWEVTLSSYWRYSGTMPWSLTAGGHAYLPSSSESFLSKSMPGVDRRSGQDTWTGWTTC